MQKNLQQSLGRFVQALRGSLCVGNKLETGDKNGLTWVQALLQCQWVMIGGGICRAEIEREAAMRRRSCLALASTRCPRGFEIALSPRPRRLAPPFAHHSRDASPRKTLRCPKARHPAPHPSS